MDVVNELNRFLERADQVKGEDMKIEALLVEMKNKYEIPESVTELEPWEENTLESDRILRAYRAILSLRSVKAHP